MVNKSESGPRGIPAEALWQETPLLEYFPELKPLYDGDGKKVQIQIGGEFYDISAQKYCDDGKWPHKDPYGIIFGVWKPDGDRVAYADYEINAKGWAKCYNKSPLAPKDFDGFGDPLFGFFLCREERGHGVGRLLLSTSLLVLESRGVRYVRFVNDATNSVWEDVALDPQWLTDSRTPKKVFEMRDPSSFYTKYSNPPKAVVGAESTTVGTRLSTMQISLVEDALGRYIPPTATR